MSDLETAQALATRYHDSLMAATGSIVAFEDAAAQYITVGSKTEAQIIEAVWDNGWNQAAEALDTFGELALLRGVNAITTDEIAALVQDAKEVNDWKSLQAAIDANSDVNFGTWLENADVTPGMTPTSSAGFTVAYSGVYQNGYGSSKAYSISDVDNTARATFILGNHDANGDNVLQPEETGVVIYSTNEDLLPLGTSSADIDVAGGYSSEYNSLKSSDYVTINTGDSVQVIIETGYNADTGLFDIFDGIDSKLEAYVEGYKDGYDAGYADGYKEGFKDGVASVSGRPGATSSGSL